MKSIIGLAFLLCVSAHAEAFGYHTSTTKKGNNLVTSWGYNAAHQTPYVAQQVTSATTGQFLGGRVKSNLGYGVTANGQHRFYPK